MPRVMVVLPEPESPTIPSMIGRGIGRERVPKRGLETRAERAVGLGRVVGAEDARACDEQVAAGGARLVDRLERDATVDLEHDRGGEQLAQPGEAAGRRRDVALPAPAGI